MCDVFKFKEGPYLGQRRKIAIVCPLIVEKKTGKVTEIFEDVRSDRLYDSWQGRAGVIWGHSRANFGRANGSGRVSDDTAYLAEL